MFNDQSVPERIDTASDWSELAVGDLHACALETTGALWCWGDNTNYAFDPAAGSVPSKRQIAGTFKSVSAANAHTCAVRTDGVLVCVGHDNNGELGQNSTGQTLPSYTPVGPDPDWASVAVGVHHSRAIK